MANGIWSSAQETTRGGASARAFKLETAKGNWNGKVYEEPLTHGRKYSKEELWENYTYFIRQIAPVAEEAGVRIGIHPDDPPVPELGGIPRHIFGTFDGYVQALEIANSPAIGVCLCCGTWMEGGKHTGKDVFEAARGFAKMGKLWKIHFRNVTAPIPYFVETYIDNGYTDMWKLMKTLVDVDFRGNLIADHVPAMAGGRAADGRTAWATFALHQAALAERKRCQAQQLIEFLSQRAKLLSSLALTSRSSTTRRTSSCGHRTSRVLVPVSTTPLPASSRPDRVVARNNAPACLEQRRVHHLPRHLLRLRGSTAP